MVLTDEWFSAAAETDEGYPIFIAGRDNIDEFRLSGRLRERIEIYWAYTPDYNGMPSESEGELMQQVMQTLQKTVEKDKLAIMTGVYTGNSERTMVFYCRKSSVFGERLNEALADFPLLPLTIYVENDPDWAEYAEMCESRPYGE